MADTNDTGSGRSSGREDDQPTVTERVPEARTGDDPLRAPRAESEVEASAREADQARRDYKVFAESEESVGARDIP